MRSERGSALVIALFTTALILATAMGALGFVDGVQQRSGKQRVKETAFNLSEALLNSEGLVLTKRWPTTAASAYPALCTAAAAGCPEPSQVLAGYATTDARAKTTWTVSVRDNLGTAATIYSRAVTDATACGGVAPCTWDSNGDGAMWVRAETTINGQVRTVVALARQQLSRISLPRNVITAGRFLTNNSGLKTIVDEKGCQAKQRPSANCNTTEPAPVVVRCTTSTPGLVGDTCLGFRSVQVAPSVLTQGFSGAILPPTTLTAMRTYAVQLGTYYTSCPPASALAGPMVFIEGVSCTYTTGTFNSAAAPGVLVVNAGALTFGGSVNFYGVIYDANNLPAPQDSGAVVSLTGGAYVQGAIFVEGAGLVSAGASGVNVSFDPNVLNNILIAGAPSFAQNSFRELLKGQ